MEFTVLDHKYPLRSIIMLFCDHYSLANDPGCVEHTSLIAGSPIKPGELFRFQDLPGFPEGRSIFCDADNCYNHKQHKQ